MSIVTDEMVEAGLKGSCMHYDDGTCAKIRAAADEIKRLREIAALARAARAAQHTYFRDRNRDNLIAAKQAEAALDKALKECGDE